MWPEKETDRKRRGVSEGWVESQVDRKGCWFAFHTCTHYTWDEDGITIDILIPNSSLPSSSFTSLSPCCHHCHCCGCPPKHKHTLTPSGCRKSSSCRVISPLLPTLSPLLSITTFSNSRLVTMWLFYLFLCVSVSANALFFMNEEWVCVGMCVG